MKWPWSSLILLQVRASKNGVYIRTCGSVRRAGCKSEHDSSATNERGAPECLHLHYRDPRQRSFYAVELLRRIVEVSVPAPVMFLMR